MRADAPIGIFDSGIGGLTVAHAIHQSLPKEKIIYFGDTAHLPYGDKSKEAVLSYSIKISEFLIEMGCKMIVIACNTASSIAYETLAAKFSNVPVIDVVNPIVAGVSRQKGLNKIAIIGTKGTIQSGIYNRMLHIQRPDLEVLSIATPLLVPVIEEGFAGTAISKAVVEKYLEARQFEDIDGLVLACTHYPLIKEDIAYFYRHRIRIFDSGDFVPEVVSKVLSEKNLLSTKDPLPHSFFVSDHTEVFERNTRLFFGTEVHLAKEDLWLTNIDGN